jgi:very-short-patch-repair endonuclease
MVNHRRESGRWKPAGNGVLKLLGTPDSYESRVLSAILGAPCDAYASHRCAARLHGLPGYPAQVELTVRRGSQLRRAAVVRHRSTALPDHHVGEIGGIPTTTLARTLFDLSAVVRPLRVARSLDVALARRAVTVLDLSRVARDLGVRGRRKSTVIRRLLAERSADFVAPESVLEQAFVDLVASSDLAQPARQVDLGDRDGWIGRVDFVYRRERVVVEIDGKEHHTALTDRLADEDRDRRLRAAGWTVVRFGWFDVVHDASRSLAALRTALRR